MNSENSPCKIKSLKSFHKKMAMVSSKSHSNRALILGAIRGGNFKVHNLSSSTDVKNLLSAFLKIGLQLKIEEKSVTFLNSFPLCENEVQENQIDLHTGDGGTTNRFLLALLSRGKKEYRLYPTEKMAQRPIGDLVDPLKKLGVKIILDSSGNISSPWITIRGPASLYNTTKLAIDCQKSTQFASALMLAFSNLPLQFEFLNLHASETYLKMTSEVIKRSLEKNSYTVPVDFSSLGYPVALAALMGELVVDNCFESDAYQSDSVLLDLLKKSGADIFFSERGLEVKKSSKLNPFSFDVSYAPDLFPTLVFLAAHIDGVSELSHLSVLKFKESDRLVEMLKVVKEFGVEAEHDPNSDVLKIRGSSIKKYDTSTIYPPRDHRIVMTAALFMMKNSGGNIYEIDCVEKSFPDFLSLLE